MPKYNIFAFCHHCADVHPTIISVILNDGPIEKASIGDTYAGRALPGSLAMLSDNEVRCPKTGQMFTQQDNHQIFLVPDDEPTLSRIRRIVAEADEDDEPKH
jgi:hypothetical protein